MTDYFYGERTQCDDFADMVEHFSPSALSAVTRSTVPLLEWLGDAANRIWLSGALGFGGTDASAVHVEFPVRASCASCRPRGRGKVSMSDAALRFAGGSLVLEAKFTESLYDSVSVWLSKGPRENRERVLRHWGHLIHPSLELRPEDAGDFVYQHVHRAASAQRFAGGSRGDVVHLLFGEDADAYLGALGRLKDLLGDTGPRIWVAVVPTSLTAAAQAHVDDADASEFVVDALTARERLFSFKSTSLQEVTRSRAGA